MTPEIKINLTSNEVREALADYVNRKIKLVENQSVRPKDVYLDVGYLCEDRPGGTKIPSFNKATITVKSKAPGGSMHTDPMDKTK